MMDVIANVVEVLSMPISGLINIITWLLLLILKVIEDGFTAIFLLVRYVLYILTTVLMGVTYELSEVKV